MRAIIAAFLFAICATASAQQQEPMTMTCFEPPITHHQSIISAAPQDGGLLYQLTYSDSVSLTTLPCLANVGSADDLTRKSVSLFSVRCMHENFTTYYGFADSVSLLSGVWSWTESGSGHRYISTMTCTASTL